MIYFKSVSYKNFLSVGNHPTTIKLDRDITTIITGANGSGKSTFIDAIVYCLFSKPFRKVKLGQLINTINEEGLVVEVEFSINNKEYKVVRGRKPEKFEIYVDNNMIEQPAKTVDYQQILENEILKLNYKTFTQIIVLGSASFKPFMQISLADRREIIENILDISVFSKMNLILKGKIKDLKSDIIDVEHKMEMTKQDHRSKMDYLKEATEEHQKRIKVKEFQKDETIEQKRLREIDKTKHEEYIDEIENSMLSCEGYEDKVLSITGQIETLKRDIEAQQAKFDLLKSNNLLVENIKEKITGCEGEISKADVRIGVLNSQIRDIDKILAEYPDLSEEYDSIKAELVTLSNSIVANTTKLNFYIENNDCSECGQVIHQDFKDEIVYKLKSDITSEKITHEKRDKRLKEINIDNKDKLQFTEDSNELAKQVTILEFDITKWQNSIDLMTEDIRTRDTEDPAAMGDLKHYIGTLENDYDKLMDSSVEIKKKHEDYVKLKMRLNDVMKVLALDGQAVDTYNIRINDLNDELIKLDETPSCSVTQEDIDALGGQVKEIDLSITKKKHMLHYYGIVQRLLKDDGLKTKIIRKFLPVINATVNMYLDKFDFPINFEFDENFNETIQSKFRNDFSYYSFSEGEKSRIDLALLFTWRDTALKKARNACNIIIFDEIFDGSLDGAGIENFMSILGLDEDGYSSFIISHKDETINSRFDRNLEFNKIGHFSEIMEN